MRIRECRDCHLAWQWPLQRTSDESIIFFDERYGSDNPPESHFNREKKNSIARLQLEFVERFYVKPGTLLDVGSGAGEFLETAASHCWSVIGVEPSLVGRRIAQEFGEGHRVYEDISQVPADQKFDVVTIWDVIEHVNDPLELISKARDKLKKHGWIFIETGNYLSVERILDGTQWWCYHPDHRWYFSNAIIEALLSRIGFNKFILCERMLRPGYIREMDINPSVLRHVKETLRRPHRLLPIWKRYFEHRKIVKRWPESAPIPIFALAATAS